MDAPQVTALVGAISGLLGSVVGGSISYLSTKLVKREDALREERRRRYDERQNLYSDFLGEAVRLTILSLKAEHKDLSVEELTRLVTLEARIWLHSEVVARSARDLATEVTRTAFPTKQDANQRRSFPDLRDEYVRICSTDLASLRNDA